MIVFNIKRFFNFAFIKHIFSDILLSMKDTIEYIFDNYLLSSSNKVDSQSTIYDEIIRQLPNELRKSVSNDIFSIKGSMGQGNKTSYPWVSILNKNITTSTQEGIYIAYLFKKDMSGLYLALNQGITHFERKYGRDKYKAARRVTKYFQDELKGSSSFSEELIDLGGSKNDLGYGYAQTTILSKYYEKGKIDDVAFKKDLSEMVSIYNLIYKHMGSKNYDDIINNVLADKEEVFISADEAIREIKQIKEIADFRPYDANISLVEVKKGEEKSKLFRKFNDSIVKKTDYIAKAVDDAKVGLYGEQLALEYENKRLESLNIYDKSAQWDSRHSDTYGYDIKSYDKDEKGNIREIFIEVKTSNSKIDSDFFVSRNELQKSKNLKENYYIFRIYDCKSSKPKFYRVNGEIEENFLLDPETYRATYKWKTIETN